jgi:hypothetical protein
MENCPKCQSDQFKKLSLIYAEGTSNGKAIGIGMTGGGNVGVGVGASASITNLATKCTPPVTPTENAGGALGALFIVGQIVTSVTTGAGWLYFFVILIPGLIFSVIQIQKEEKEMLIKHTAALEDYDKKFMCLRCEMKTATQ